MKPLEEEMMATYDLYDSGANLQYTRGDDNKVLLGVVPPTPLEAEQALGPGAYRDIFAASEAAGAPVTEQEVAGTLGGVVPGAAIGVGTGIQDIGALVYGGIKAATAEEGQRIDDFLKGFSAISGVIGSEKAFELYDAGVDMLPISDEAKQGLKQGAMVGEVIGFGGTAAKTGKATVEAAADYAAGAPSRIADRTSGAMLGANVDPTAIVDEAIVAGQKLMGKEPVPVGRMGSGGVLSQVGEAEMPDAPQSYGGGRLPLTKDSLEKADDTTKLLVSRILEANPDAALGLVRSGSAAGPSNYLTLKTADGQWHQVRISGHSTGIGNARIFDYIEHLPIKIPPEGKQVFGQPSRESFDNRINKIVDLMTPRPTAMSGAASAADMVAGQKLMGKEPVPVPQAVPDAINLSDEEKSASLIDDLYGDGPTLEVGGNLYDVAKRINERSKSFGNRSDPTPENQTKIARVMAREALQAMQSKGNAGDWYRQKVDNAMRIAERVYPEVAADPNKANAIKFITAITSNGASVPENSKNTFAVFDQYLKTGKMPDVGYGKETNAMKKAFELHNNLVDEMGETEFYDFMSQEFTVREIDQIGKKYGFSVSGEAKDTKLPASVIFGPKIGGGFYQNLQGNYKPLTMDRWFMRTWGRYTGGLIVEQSPQAAAKQMDRIRNSVTPEIAADYGYSYDDLLSDDILLQELAYRAHKAYVKSGYKDKTELNKSSKNFVEAQKKVLEQPRTGSERNYMRSTVDEALGILSQQGIELDRAALQALIWYPEKELYAKLGIGTKRSAPTDYETEFATVATERGVDVSDIIGDAQP